MDKKSALASVKPHLTERRYIHTVGVMNTALKMAEREDVDTEKVWKAAIFHDYAKYRPKDEMRRIIRDEGWNEGFIEYGDELLHAPAGAYLVRKEIGISDEEILSAIFWHTTGKANMNTIEKIIFLADYIEPNRDFPGVEEVREAANQKIDYAILLALRNTIIFLLKKQQCIFPETLHAYNYMMDKYGKEEDDVKNGK